MPNKKIELNIHENNITNIDSILSYLDSTSMDDAFKIHLESLKNHLNSLNVCNKHLLEDAINRKLIQYQALENPNNEVMLRILKNVLIEFQKLAVVTINDADILLFKTSAPGLDAIELDAKNTLTKYVIENINTITMLSAEKVFYQLKENVLNPLNFKNTSSISDISDLINTDNIEKELNFIDAYKSKYGISFPTSFTVTTSGMVLYKVGDGLMYYNKAKKNLEILLKPTLKTTDYKEVPITNSEKFLINDENYNASRITDLISKRDTYDYELTTAERQEIDAYIEYLLSYMEKLVTSQKEADRNIEILIDIMELKRGTKPCMVLSSELTAKEKVYVKTYLESKKRMHLLGLDKNLSSTKSLELNQRNTSGVTTILIVLELIALAMMVLMLLRLDI